MLSIYPSIYIFLYLSSYVYLCLSIYLSICLYMSVYIHICIYLLCIYLYIPPSKSSAEDAACGGLHKWGEMGRVGIGNFGVYIVIYL